MESKLVPSLCNDPLEWLFSASLHLLFDSTDSSGPTMAGSPSLPTHNRIVLGAPSLPKRLRSLLKIQKI